MVAMGILADSKLVLIPFDGLACARKAFIRFCELPDGWFSRVFRRFFSLFAWLAALFLNFFLNALFGWHVAGASVVFGRGLMVVVDSWEDGPRGVGYGGDVEGKGGRLTAAFMGV